ncbi:MAG: hypothetical protein E6G89_17235 [Alphaproteobacteria bacterium]|nr:MAG: hypothetical protein E6G89_17235 [Alphaproteobacteria bacterium]
MCDYSLHHVASRPAKVGDRLVTSAFDGSTTHGFCAVDEPGVAVCLRPGTELAFESDVQGNSAIIGGLGLESGELGGKVARFTQIDMDRPALRRGQMANVLQLPAELQPRREAKESIPTPEYIG